MIHFIAIHWLAAIGVAFFIALLAALLAGGLCRSAALHDEPNLIEPGDLMEQEHPCAWCQKEQAIKAQPHESHGICQRHYDEMCQEVERITQKA